METVVRRGRLKTTLFFAFLFSVIVFSVSSPMVWAKSVFAIASHANGLIKAYSVDPNNAITWQATIANTENFGGGAGGFCLWPQKDRMFVNYEDDGKISWASIKNLNRNSQTDKCDTGIGMPGGMVVDEAMSRLYVILRGDNKLYAFDYDEEVNTLNFIPLSQTTNYVTLQGVSTGIDIDLDPQGSTFMGIPVGRLYVSNMSSTIRYYNTMTWELEGSFDLGHSAVGVGLDKTRGYLYAGYFPGGDSGQNYLMRYKIDGDPNDSEIYLEKDMGASIMDIAVDNDTGYIYMTLKRSNSGHTGIVEVYDPSNWVSTDPNTLVLIDSESDDDFISEGPGGIAIGPSYKFSRMHIAKQDDKTACVSPQDLITYTIAFHPDRQDETNVFVTDKLPQGVDFVSADPNTGTYYERPDHVCVWELGDVEGYDPNIPGDPNIYLTLTVRVNTDAEPTGQLINIVEAESDESWTKGSETTPVCCWDSGDIVFVNWRATGTGSGINWQNAYTDLQDAIARVNRGCGTQIWVAKGTYRPGLQTTDSFTVTRENISFYGGFAGTETSIDQRNITANPTILSGNTGIYDGSTLRRNITIVTMGNNSLLSGFVVRDSSGYGIRGQIVSFAVEHCVVENNLQYGISADNCISSIKWTTLKNNGYDGIYHRGYNTKTIVIENCQFLENGKNGIYTEFSIPTIRNNQICFNGMDNSGSYYGLYLYYPQTGYTIFNNTVIYNAREGIRVDSSSAKDIRNCILYGNKDSTDEQLRGNITAHYSCIWDPNHIYTTPDTNYNISCDPQFAYDDNPSVTIYRLLASSPCIDKGDLALPYDNQTDLDGEERVYNSRVDLGADEAVSCDSNLTNDDIYNPLDLDADGLVNLNEFKEFSNVWLAHDPNDPAVLDPDNPVHDPNSPTYISPAQIAAWYPDGWKLNFSTEGASLYAIDLSDLTVLIEDAPWLWVSCWRTDIQELLQQQMMMQSSMIVNSPALESTCSTAALGSVDVTDVQINQVAATDSDVSGEVDGGLAALSAESVDVFDPAKEQATIKSLLRDIDTFIEAGGEDAQAWAEMKDILKQSLVDMEVMINDPNEI